MPLSASGVCYQGVQVEHAPREWSDAHQLLMAGRGRWICPLPNGVTTPWRQFLSGAATLCLSCAQDIGIALGLGSIADLISCWSRTLLLVSSSLPFISAVFFRPRPLF